MWGKEPRCGGRSPVGDALDFIMNAGTSGGVRFGSGRLDNGRAGPQKPSMWVAEGAKSVSQTWLRREVAWEGFLSEAWWVGDDTGLAVDIGGSQTRIQLGKELVMHKVPRNGGGDSRGFREGGSVILDMI